MDLYLRVDFPLVIKIGTQSIFEDLKYVLQRFKLNAEETLIITTKHLYDLYLHDSEFIKSFNTAFINFSSIDETITLFDIEVKGSSYKAIIGFGGGKVLDVAKYIAFLSKKIMISIPTTLSHDGIASPISVLTDASGVKHSLPSKMPNAVIIDLNLIKKAPINAIVAGIGDVLSNLSALKDWILANKEIGEPINNFAYALSYTGAKMIYLRTIYDIKKQSDILNDEFLYDLAYALILSGYSMQIAGSSRPASGAEHLISHAIDFLYPEKSSYHGFQVAYGILIAERLRGMDISNWLEMFRKIGLPTSYKDLNLTKEEVIRVILYAPKIRKRYTIFNKVKLSREIIENDIII